MNNLNKITLIGCGFLGSHLAEELAKLVYSQEIPNISLEFIDFDKWEDRNSANQNVNLRTASSNEYKAITCKMYADSYFIKSSAVTKKITAHNALDYLKSSMLIIDTVDNLETRQLLNILSSGGEIAPCMHVGISRKGEGLVNWSSTVIDTFPFKIENTQGRDLKEQDVKEPPCIMYKYRASGLYLIQAAAKSFSYFMGKDPWLVLSDKEEIPKGTITCWTTSPLGEQKLMLEDMYLDKKKTYFPILDLDQLAQGVFKLQKDPLVLV